MPKNERIMNGKKESEWEKIHRPAGHKIREGCRAKIHVPHDRADRDVIWQAVQDYQAEHGLEPFMDLDDLVVHADVVLDTCGYTDVYQKWAMVMLNNESAREALAEVPFRERLLLLPQCLRKKDICTATFDAMGLLCAACGACHILPFEDEAEYLGYATLVSEGTAAVMNVVQTGGVKAFVGVSCLSTLEKVFPFMSTFKIPAMAVPLLNDTCRFSEVDADWVQHYMNVRTPGAWDIPDEPFAYEPPEDIPVSKFDTPGIGTAKVDDKDPAAEPAAAASTGAG